MRLCSSPFTYVRRIVYSNVFWINIFAWSIRSSLRNQLYQNWNCCCFDSFAHDTLPFYFGMVAVRHAQARGLSALIWGGRYYLEGGRIPTRPRKAQNWQTAAPLPIGQRVSNVGARSCSAALSKKCRPLSDPDGSLVPAVAVGARRVRRAAFRSGQGPTLSTTAVGGAPERGRPRHTTTLQRVAQPGLPCWPAEPRRARPRWTFSGGGDPVLGQKPEDSLRAAQASIGAEKGSST